MEVKVMFFSDRIQSIMDKDVVLEVGPGSDPHNRSNVLLEVDYDEETLKAQRGNTPALKTDKPIRFYDGKRFPFNDNEFDYIICSHVMEHVSDPIKFFDEMTRVADKGYIEFPTIYYEYLYNFDVHLNFMHYDAESNTILFMKKSSSPLNYFKKVNDLMLRTLEMGYTEIVDDLKHIMFQGFEWYSNNKPRIVEVSDLEKLLISPELITKKEFFNQQRSIPRDEPLHNTHKNNSELISRALRIMSKSMRRLFR